MVANAKARALEHLINAKLLQLSEGLLFPLGCVYLKPIFTPPALPTSTLDRVGPKRGAGGEQLHHSQRMGRTSH